MFRKPFSLVLLFLFALALNAQKKYYDASAFPLLGKITDDTESKYERLPAYLKENTRPALWGLGKNTAGLAVRFKSNSTSISVKWDLLGDVVMDHMPFTGIKGVDLYEWNGNKWQFAGVGRPTRKSNNEQIISGMEEKEREYLLYLPLYDGVNKVEIGIDSLAQISRPSLPFPKRDNPIVVYGTSITQGGCASRPGMAYTNILERKTNREVINLGFSGNGRLDYEIAELIAKRNDASLIILDFLPNVTPVEVTEKTARFFSIIRRNNPGIPILFIENVLFPTSVYDMNSRKIVSEKNKNLKTEYEKLIQSGQKNIYYLSAAHNFIGADNEATVDGIHYTDLGFSRFADLLFPVVDDIVSK